MIGTVNAMSLVQRRPHIPGLRQPLLVLGVRVRCVNATEPRRVPHPRSNAQDLRPPTLAQARQGPSADRVRLRLAEPSAVPSGQRNWNGLICSIGLRKANGSWRGLRGSRPASLSQVPPPVEDGETGAFLDALPSAAASAFSSSTSPPHDQTALTRPPFDLQPLLKVHGGGVVVVDPRRRS